MKKEDHILGRDCAVRCTQSAAVMSALGQKRTLKRVRAMPGGCAFTGTILDVRRALLYRAETAAGIQCSIEDRAVCTDSSDGPMAVLLDGRPKHSEQSQDSEGKPYDRQNRSGKTGTAGARSASTNVRS